MFNLPKEIKVYLEDTNASDVSCRSNAMTYHFDQGLFLKIDDKNELKKEYEMSMLLFKLGLGPKVIKYVSKDKDYLLTEEVKGKDLTHLINNPILLVNILATSLKKLHSLPIDNVPISSRFNRYIDSSNGNFSGGYYDNSFLLNGEKMTKEEAWKIIQEKKHLLNCDTFIHGDACLPNLISNDDEFARFIDLGLSGLGDRHIDIFWALWSLEYNLQTDKYNEMFLDIYGRENYSKEMIDIIKAFEVFG